MGHKGNYWKIPAREFGIEKSAEHSTRAESCLAAGRKREKGDVRWEKQEKGERGMGEGRCRQKGKEELFSLLFSCFSLLT